MIVIKWALKVEDLVIIIGKKRWGNKIQESKYIIVRVKDIRIELRTFDDGGIT